MSPKDTAKSKRSAAARKPAASVAKVAKTGSADLAAENAALKKRLASAQARIELLERQRDEALNRIAWVIDSINTLAESVR